MAYTIMQYYSRITYVFMSVICINLSFIPCIPSTRNDHNLYLQCVNVWPFCWISNTSMAINVSLEKMQLFIKNGCANPSARMFCYLITMNQTLKCSQLRKINMITVLLFSFMQFAHKRCSTSYIGFRWVYSPLQAINLALHLSLHCQNSKRASPLLKNSTKEYIVL